jgi:DNA-binding protein YbaB
MDLDAIMRMAGPLQQTLAKADAERPTTVFEGTAGGGAVKARINGALNVERVAIAPAAAAAAGGDVGMLEDLVAAAVGDALRQYRARYGVSSQESMQKLMGGADLGGLMGMLKPT